MSWPLAAGLLAGAVLAEVAGRSLVVLRTATLVRQVVAPSPDLAVTLPRRPVLPGLLAGRVAALDVTCRRLTINGLEVDAVAMRLQQMRVDPRLRVRGGSGWLDGELSAEEVLRMAGVRGTALELGEGTATVRWPAGRLRLPQVEVRLRPTLEGRRIRLYPTPLSIALPPLPDGVTVETVTVAADALRIGARIDLPRLFS